LLALAAGCPPVTPSDFMRYTNFISKSIAHVQKLCYNAREAGDKLRPELLIL
jgi:hypothetical protein